MSIDLPRRLETKIAALAARVTALEADRAGQTKRQSDQADDMLDRRADAKLPHETKGRGRRENLTGFHEETFEGGRRPIVSLMDIYKCLTKYPNIYKRRHLEVLALYYREQLSHREAAKRLGISQSMVYRHLKEAKQRYEQFKTRQKKEIYDSLVQKVR